MGSGSGGGIAATELRRQLGLGSYPTAWTWLHRIRKAMRRPDRKPLTGKVEVDETCLGGPRPGKSGRSAAGKTLKERGLASVELVVADDHAGRRSIGTVVAHGGVGAVRRRHPQLRLLPQRRVCRTSPGVGQPARMGLDPAPLLRR